jgi:Transposase DDE domain
LLIDRLPGRQVGRQPAPWRAGAHDGAHGVQDLTQVMPPLRRGLGQHTQIGRDEAHSSSLTSLGSGRLFMPPFYAGAEISSLHALRAQWTPGTKLGRSVCRFFGEEYVERMRAYQSTAAYQKALRKRQVWVERLFAEAKEWHGLRRFRLRRLWRVNSEALLLAAGQNLKRLLATDGWGRRPLPGGAALALTPSAGSVVCVVCCVWGIVLLEDRHRSGGAAPDTRPVFIAV